MQLIDSNPGDTIIIKSPEQRASTYIVCKVGNTSGIQVLPNKTICVNLETGRLVQKFNYLQVELIKPINTNGNR